MHYQHRYHAGNFADVFKHVLLIGLLESLSQKDTPWAYLDTHAGAGRYRWDDEALQRTGEVEGGLRRVLASASLSGWLVRYAELAQAERGSFPGSPAVAAALHRPQDRLMLCESQPAIAAQLRDLAGPSVAVHERDGYGAWALLPPPEKRGVVLIDPPFEARDELDRMTAFAQKAVQRFAQGIQAHWYPVKGHFPVDRFVRRLATQTGRPVLDARLWVGPPAEGRMRGCGLAVVNPPYAFRQALPEVMAALQTLLAQDAGAGHHIQLQEPTA